MPPSADLDPRLDAIEGNIRLLSNVTQWCVRMYNRRAHMPHLSLCVMPSRVVASRNIPFPTEIHAWQYGVHRWVLANAMHQCCNLLTVGIVRYWRASAATQRVAMQGNCQKTLSIDAQLSKNCTVVWTHASRTDSGEIW